MKVLQRSNALRPASLGPSPRCQRRASRATVVVVRASEEGGVQDLLARDRRLVGLPNVVPELSDDPGPSTEVKNKGSDSEVVKTRKKRQADMAKAAEARADPNRPKNCKQAIDKGLELFQQKQFQAAVDMFNLALELPGNGAYRMAASPREYSCPSDAEENAALFNMACAYAQMGQKASAMTCIEAILDNGFTDFDTIRNDADLAPLRGTELELLLFKFSNPVSKALNPVANLFNLGQKKPVQSDTNKPWILW